MDFSKYAQPKYLIVGGVALVGGLYFASKMKGRKSGVSGDSEEIPPTIISTTRSDVTDIADETALQSLREELMDLRDLIRRDGQNVAPDTPAPLNPVNPAQPTPAQPTPAQAPNITGFSASVQGNTVRLSWIAPPSPYRVIIRNEITGVDMQATPDGATSWSFQGKAGTSYTLSARAFSGGKVGAKTSQTISIPAAPIVPSPQPPRTEPRPDQSQPIISVPGNYPLDCRDVIKRPSDHPGSDISSLVKAKGGNTRALAIVLEWAVMGEASSGSTGLSRFTGYVANKNNWSHINSRRRSRGLKAMSTPVFESLVNTLHGMNAQTGGKDDKLTQAMVQSLWNNYHVPYLC